MKKILTTILLTFTIYGWSQTAADVFTSENIVYYGLDFSKAKLVGDFGNGDGAAMKRELFTGWNALILKETEKYNIAKAFRKTSVFYDVNPVTIQNEKVAENNIKTLNDPEPLSSSDIARIVNSYVPGEKSSGIGLVFIVESFSKTSERAWVHVTLFDIATKKILFTEKMKATPRGIGLKSYWANTINQILISITDFKYKEWEKKYSS